MTQWDYTFDISQKNVDDVSKASDHDSTPRVKGLILLEANSLGKITLSMLTPLYFSDISSYLIFNRSFQ
jgi:hypothetical protein